MTKNNLNRYVAPEGEKQQAATIARICPICGHKLSVLYDGQHDAERQKCKNCRNEVYLPPVCIG